MPILTEDVKLMASQRLTDNEDGGGRMTGVEIVDGNVNNLFPDISRLDRVYGRVSLREAFIHVNTVDNDTYSGAHVILSLPATDPNVSVCIFETGNLYDYRAAARDRVESYVTVGPRFRGWLWGDQPAGSRSLLIFAIKGTTAPDVGSVLCLYEDKGTASEVKQFVRITSVEVTSSDFASTSEGDEYGAVALTYKRDIMQIEIGDPLRTTFTGSEISQNDSLTTNVYTTTVSDSADYFGVMTLTQAVGTTDIEINVNSIFANLVPSAQGESPMTDLSVGEAGPVVGSGVQYSFIAVSFAVTNGTQLHFGTGIKPLTLAITSTSHSYTDDGDGILMEGATQVGTVDYPTGTITFSAVTSYTASLNVAAQIGVEVPRVPNTMWKYIALANRGYNYVAIMHPLPVPGSVWVDYMAQGKWYRLRDNGKGFLVPDISGTGTGTINYATGSITLTCGALPDVESSILYNWANPVETVDLAGIVTIDVAEVNHTLAHHPVAPGSFAMSWPTGASSTATAADDGNGNITGGATGWINYSTGELAFTPLLLPVSGGEYTIDYEKYPIVTGTTAGGSGIITATLPTSPIKPKSVSMEMVVNFNGYQHVYQLSENGSGGLSAPGWSLGMSMTHPTWPGSMSGGGITGTIDYTTGICQIDLTEIQGQETWTEPVVEEVCAN